jgi:outer membrane receptor for monomeric catechols
MVFSFPVRLICRGARWLGLGGLAAIAAVAAEPAVRTFQLPAGEAEQTLRQFVEQAGQEVVYWVDRVRGVQTNPVSGEMTAAAALEKMLAETGLSLSRDETSGALTIQPRQAGAAARRGGVAGREVVRLSPYEVSSGAYSGYVASRTFAGGKTVLKLTDVPQTLQVVTRDLIDDTGAIDPNEVLSKIVPGVSGFSGPTGVNAIIRGFRAQNWSVDGATTRYLGMITNFNFDAFEVIKGPASVTFGPFAAYGGYINMVPKKPRRNHLNKAEASVGTDNFYSGMIDVGDEAGPAGDLQYRLVAGFVDTDRPGMNWDFNRVQMVAPSVAYDISTDSRVTVRFEFSHTDQKFSTTALDATGRLVESFASQGPALPDMNRVNRDDNRLMQLVFTHRVNDEWSMRFNLMGGLGKKQFNQLHLIGQAAAEDYLLNPFQADYRWKNLFVDYSVSWRVPEIGSSGVSNHLVASASLDHWDITYTIFDGSLIAPVNTWRVDPRAPDWPGLSYRFTYPTRYILYNTEWLGGAVIEDRVGFLDDRLQLSAAVRWNYDNRSSHTIWRTPQNQNPGGVYTGNPVPANINERPTFRYGLVYKPVESVAFYAGYTEAYLAIGAIYKVDGSRLEPESGNNREIGLKVDLVEAWGGTFSGNFAFFRVEVENKWRSDPVNTGFFIQDGVQTNTGAELQIIYTSEKFSGLIGFYSGDGPTERGTGLRAVLVPDFTANLWLKYNLTRRLSIGGGYKHVGETISNNRLYLTEPFGTADLFASYTVPLRRGTVTYRVGVTNLADDPAIYRMDSAAAVYREDGRRAKATVSYAW